VAAGIGALIAHVAFWVLLVYGWFWEELGAKGIIAFVILWIAGYVGLQLIPQGPDMFFSWVALLDVALVFIIFKGDIRLS
jgi:hypothetical protein